MKYKYEFEALDDFEPGDCEDCPLHFEQCGEDEYGDWDVTIHCTLDCHYSKCPLQEIT